MKPTPCALTPPKLYAPTVTFKKLDPEAQLAVLLATTGLSQLDLARLLRVAGRTVRRWMQGECVPPPVAIERLEALARTLDEDADFVSGRWASKDRRTQSF